MKKQYEVRFFETRGLTPKLRHFSTNNQEKALELYQYLTSNRDKFWLIQMRDNGVVI